MKLKIFMLGLLLTLGVGRSYAGFPVIDPTNLVQNTFSAIRSSTTATNMISNFQETVKIYKQGKEYYDALKKVHNLVKDARKVQQTILMIGDISDIYVNSFQRMLNDPYFSAQELTAIAAGYAVLLDEAGNALADLKQVVNSNGLSLSDKDRLDVVDACYQRVYEFRALTQYYTNKNIGVSYLRAKKQDDTDRVMALYGHPSERYW